MDDKKYIIEDAEDLEYFQKKIFAALKIPPEYFTGYRKDMTDEDYVPLSIDEDYYIPVRKEDEE